MSDTISIKVYSSLPLFEVAKALAEEISNNLVVKRWNHLVIIEGDIFPEIILTTWGEPGVELLKRDKGVTVNTSISFLLDRMELLEFRSKIIDYIYIFLLRRDVFSDFVGDYNSDFILRRGKELIINAKSDFWRGMNSPLLDCVYTKAK